MTFTVPEAYDRFMVREECRHRLGSPAGPLRPRARAWAVRGRA